MFKEDKCSQGNFLTVYVHTEVERESPSLLYVYRDSFGKVETNKETPLTLPWLWYKIGSNTDQAS
jgi:hypothetical protein